MSFLAKKSEQIVSVCWRSACIPLQRFLRLFCAEASRIFDHHLGQSDDGIEGGALSGSCTFKTVDSATPNTLLIAGNDVQIAGSKANFLELLTVNVKRERRPPRAVGASWPTNLGGCTVVPGVYEKAPTRRII